MLFCPGFHINAKTAPITVYSVLTKVFQRRTISQEIFPEHDPEQTESSFCSRGLIVDPSSSEEDEVSSVPEHRGWYSCEDLAVARRRLRNRAKAERAKSERKKQSSEKNNGVPDWMLASQW